MSIYPVYIPNSVNHRLNSLFKKIEIVCIVLLFIVNFDAKNFGFEGILNSSSYVLLFFLIFFRWKRCIYVATKDLSLLLLVAVVMLSFLWSADIDSTLGVSRSVLRAFLFGVYLAAQYQPKEFLQLMLKMFGAALVLNIIFSSVVIAIGQPGLAVAMNNNESSWQGFLTHKQYLGRMMAHSSLLFLLSALSNKRLRLIYWLGFIFSLLFLILSQSKTALLIFLLGLSMLPILKLANLKYKLRTIIYIISIFIIGTIVILIFSNFETVVVDILRKPPDLNGRLDMWNLAIQAGLKHPWLGYGWGGFWNSSEAWSVISNVPWVANVVLSSNKMSFHSHNGYIEIFLQLGIIGLLIFAFTVLLTLKRILKLLHLTNSVESLWMLVFITTSLLGLVSETLVMLGGHTIFSIYVSIVLLTKMWDVELNLVKSSKV
ncbi:MAG: O-antigen ligase family protein [Gloeotrichia echinulata DEX184]|nr:O-antigen ligase family protein [Gloeotrichia echinulata DEX184]